MSPSQKRDYINKRYILGRFSPRRRKVNTGGWRVHVKNAECQEVSPEFTCSRVSRSTDCYFSVCKTILDSATSHALLFLTKVLIVSPTTLPKEETDSRLSIAARQRSERDQTTSAYAGFSVIKLCAGTRQRRRQSERNRAASKLSEWSAARKPAHKTVSVAAGETPRDRGPE